MNYELANDVMILRATNNIAFLLYELASSTSAEKCSTPATAQWTMAFVSEEYVILWSITIILS